MEAVERDQGRTALMLAAVNGHVDIVNALAGMHSANVEAADEHGKTALMLAAYNGHTEIVNALDTHGANAKLMLAAENGHTDT